MSNVMLSLRNTEMFTDVEPVQLVQSNTVTRLPVQGQTRLPDFLFSAGFNGSPVVND